MGGRALGRRERGREVGGERRELGEERERERGGGRDWGGERERGGEESRRERERWGRETSHDYHSAM